MGDSSERSFPVYLPPAYQQNSAERYPVIFWLSGWSGRGSYYLREESVFQRPLELRLDEEILEKRLPACIVVFVDGGSKLGCSQYINSEAIGNYSDYICDELVNFIDRTLRTIPSADFRAIAGHSSGGFGAMINGMTRADRFQYICSSAGDSFFEVNLPRNISFAVEILERMGGVSAFIKSFLLEPHRYRGGSKEFDTMLTLSMAPCFAPNTSIPDLFGDLFFDLKTGRIHEDIWTKYLSWDPIRRINQCTNNLSSLRYVLLEAGISDEHGLQLGHRQFAERLSFYNVPCEVVEYPGGHGGHNWRLEGRFKKLLQKMPLP